MHESVQRLLQFASAQATRTSREQVTRTGQLARLLGVTAATMTNWKTRGVSKEGAIQAECVLGCDAYWVLHGVKRFDPIAGEPKVTLPSAPPPSDFADRKEATDSDWDVLQDLKDMPATERDLMRQAIHEKAEHYRSFMRETLGRMRAAPIAAKPAPPCDPKQRAPK